MCQSFSLLLSFQSLINHECVYLAGRYRYRAMGNLIRKMYRNTNTLRENQQLNILHLLHDGFRGKGFIFSISCIIYLLNEILRSKNYRCNQCGFRSTEQEKKRGFKPSMLLIEAQRGQLVYSFFYSQRQSSPYFCDYTHTQQLSG